VNGKLYGTTLTGGNVIDNASYGTVFSLDPKTGAETVVYAFCSQPNCVDGAEPSSSLIYTKGELYGTTITAGPNFDGTVFAVDPNSGAETIVYSFGAQQNGADGLFPRAGVIKRKKTLYGTTSEGGSNSCKGFGCGTLFSFNPSTGAETVLYSFGNQQNGADGLYPQAAPIDVKGVLYGTTSGGGLLGCGGSGCGTVFSLDPNTGIEAVLYPFCSRKNCTDGARPSASLLVLNGKLYGTTTNGGGTGCGGKGCGTVFVLKKTR
jgi:uncharacterized repeat protein (TIGR03803 family)